MSANAGCVYEQVVEGENLQIGTMLTWSTSFEDETSVFIVEKSVDGIEFEEIGNVNAAGDSDDLKDYNFLDIMAKSSRIFYRLKQVDNDATFSYTDIVTVNLKYQNNFMIARMSAIATQGEFAVTIDSFEDGEMTYSLNSVRGEQILEDKMLIINGLNDLEVDLKDQRVGLYKLSLEMGDEIETIVLKKIDDELKKKTNMASSKKLNGNED
ncbi:MAG: hypothetical protein AB8G22_00215 [Saprospiraceae bacterium]